MREITALQMRILTLAYTYDGAVERLRPRYWAVIPNFVGMSEDEAAALCTLTGFVPKIVHEPLSWSDFSENDIARQVAIT